MVENVLDFQGHSLTRPHVGDLAEPAIWKSRVLVVVLMVIAGLYSLPLMVGWVISLLMVLS